MAGNFWASSHCAQWILDRVDLLRERAADLAVLTEDEYQKIFVFYASFIQVESTDHGQNFARVVQCGTEIQEIKG